MHLHNRNFHNLNRSVVKSDSKIMFYPNVSNIGFDDFWIFKQGFEILSFSNLSKVFHFYWCFQVFSGRTTIEVFLKATKCPWISNQQLLSLFMLVQFFHRTTNRLNMQGLQRFLTKTIPEIYIKNKPSFFSSFLVSSCFFSSSVCCG